MTFYIIYLSVYDHYKNGHFVQYLMSKDHEDYLIINFDVPRIKKMFD